MSKIRPFVQECIEQFREAKTLVPEVYRPMPAEACTELGADTAPVPGWSDRLFDFLACCVLAVAMAVMEEPKRAGRMSPPPMPWRELGCGAVVIFAAVSAVYLVLGGAR